MVPRTSEGIEENGQLAGLLQLGCDIGQGYLFGKAMPAAEAGIFIREREAGRVAAGLAAFRTPA